MCGANLPLAAPGKTAGPLMSTPTRPSGRALRRPEWSRSMPGRSVALRAFLACPIVFIAVFLLVPLGLTIVISFWTRVGLLVRPGFTLSSYAAFFNGVRLLVFERSLAVSTQATVLGL